MELGRFKPGDVLHLHVGSRARVLAPSEDGRWIRVRYAESAEDPLFSGSEDLLADHEVAGFTPAPPSPEWGQKVAVVVHHVPESEEFEGGYEAVTMAGVPENVIVTVTDRDSAEGALNHLIAGLSAFGFSGRVAVEDATYIGGIERYEVEIP
jgi:hypothetical protein